MALAFSCVEKCPGAQRVLKPIGLSVADGPFSTIPRSVASYALVTLVLLFSIALAVITAMRVKPSGEVVGE